MLINGNDHQSTNTLDDFSDYVVIGSGPAGLAVALNLARQGRKVTILESTDQPQSPQSTRATGFSTYYEGGENTFMSCTTAKYLGASGSGRVYGPDFLSNTRMRTYGGSSNCWGCTCVPLTEFDFEEHSWIKGSGWPFGLSELAPYYEAASKMAYIGEYSNFDLKKWTNLGYVDPFANNEKIMTVMAQQGLSQYYRWQNLYGNEIAQSQNIRLIQYANVTNLNMEGSRVTSISYLDSTNNSKIIPAKNIIVACGGVESVRLLQFSKIPDYSGTLGKFFMVHPLISGAATISADAQGNQPTFGGIFADHLPAAQPNQANMQTWAALTPKAMQENKVLNIRFFINQANGVQKINLNWEQAASDKNQISLDWDGPRDPAGNPKAKVYWELGQMEMDTITVALDAINEYLTSVNPRWVMSDRVDQMKMECVGADNTTWGQYTGWGSSGVWAAEHHMGATRMSTNPREGVVDENCKVHGVDNLYISSSSVFPSVGFANPTYTIIAMALRLADHLCSKDQGPVSIKKQIHLAKQE